MQEFNLQITEAYLKKFANFKAKCIFDGSDVSEALLQLLDNPTANAGLETQALNEQIVALELELKDALTTQTQIREQLQVVELINAEQRGELKRIADLERLLSAKESEIETLKRSLQIIETYLPAQQSEAVSSLDLGRGLRRIREYLGFGGSKPELKAVS